MPLNNIEQLPAPPVMMDWDSVNDYLQRLYQTLSNWHLALSSTEFTGGSGYVRIEDRAPLPGDGNDDDIWIETS